MKGKEIACLRLGSLVRLADVLGSVILAEGGLAELPFRSIYGIARQRVVACGLPRWGVPVGQAF